MKRTSPSKETLYRVPFLQDVQQTLGRMQQDFPNLCDIHALVIHPSYEALASALGFQKTHRDFPTSLYWMYLPLDRFLALDVATAIADAFGQQDAVAKSVR
ncbi:MAG: hypothetical protein IGR92_04905 [Leptolyngbyaceae cyanobacterium T60_A2020_046]|nr:hypothetical protein [Leptolyngbyaceae cyanobacterium T60_A2020_046]